MSTSLEQIPDDITFDIISGLPPKEMCCLKTLSKKWNQMLSDSSFKKLYHERLQKAPKLFVTNLISSALSQDGEFNEEELVSMSLSDFEGETIYYENFITKIAADARMLYAAKGGLICFANEKKFFTFNPTSKRFTNLPRISSSFTDDFSEVGFGYDTSSNEYIFVHIFDIDEGDGEEDQDYMRCEWLTLSEANQEDDISTSLSWKVLKTTCPFILSNGGVYVDGLFYFCVSIECLHTAKEILVSVDVKKEIFKTIGHPDETLFDEDNYRFVVELNGQLCFGEIYEDSPEMDLWILKNAEKGEWSRLCRIELQKLSGFDTLLDYETSLIGLRNGELIFHNYKMLIFYNVEDETSRKGVSIPTQSRVCLYTESLSFLNTGSSYSLEEEKVESEKQT